jgi:hypothetical protein
MWIPFDRKMWLISQGKIAKCSTICYDETGNSNRKRDYI